MPHSVRDETDTRNRRWVVVVFGVVVGTFAHIRSDNQLSPSSTAVGDASNQQSPMLKAWSDELDPRNLTINETLFLGGLTE
jgi:hypothetical protein